MDDEWCMATQQSIAPTSGERLSICKTSLYLVYKTSLYLVCSFQPTLSPYLDIHTVAAALTLPPLFVLLSALPPYAIGDDG